MARTTGPHIPRQKTTRRLSPLWTPNTAIPRTTICLLIRMGVEIISRPCPFGRLQQLLPRHLLSTSTEEAWVLILPCRLLAISLLGAILGAMCTTRRTPQQVGIMWTGPISPPQMIEEGFLPSKPAFRTTTGGMVLEIMVLLSQCHLLPIHHLVSWLNFSLSIFAALFFIAF